MTDPAGAQPLEMSVRIDLDHEWARSIARGGRRSSQWWPSRRCLDPSGLTRPLSRRSCHRCQEVNGRIPYADGSRLSMT